MSAFADGYKAATGRYPTESDYGRLRDERQRRIRSKYPDEPSTFEKVAAYGAPLLGAYITHSALSDGPTMLGDAARSIRNALFGSGSQAATQAATQTAANTGAGVAIPGSVGSGASAGTGMGLGTLGTGLGLAAGAYGTYKLAESLKDQGEYQMDSDDLIKSTGSNAAQGAAAGAAIGSVIPGIGTALGAVIGGLIGGGGSAGMNVFGSGKSQDQLVRDQLRSRAINAGVMGEDYNVNGVDLGLDGGFRFGDGRRIYEITPESQDGSEPTFTADQSRAIGMLNPLGDFLSGGDDKYGNQLTSMFVNAVQEGGDQGINNSEIRQIYDRTGLGQADLFEGVNELHRMGRITEDEARARQNALNELYGQEYYSPLDEDQRMASVDRFRSRFFS